MAVATGLRLCICFFFGFAIICSARNTISFSGEEAAVVVEAAPTAEGRSLEVNLNDYSEASANHGHDPRNKVVGGRRSREFP